MKLVSISELSALTSKTRETVGKALRNIRSEPGPNNAKFYPSDVALERVYGVFEKGDAVSLVDAQRQLAVARRQEIEVNIEISRKERIPLEDVNEVNEEALMNVAGVLKAHVGRVLTMESVNDMFTELRGVGDKLKRMLE